MLGISFSVLYWAEKVRSVIPPDTLVHFDLDAKNVFVGECSEGWEPEIVPVLKVADLASLEL